MDHRAIMSLVNRRVTRLLDVAETALPGERFQPFRKIMLEEFGRNGLEKELVDLCYGSTGLERNGTGRK